MRYILRCLLAATVSTACYADLTVDQKVADFMQLAGLYSKHYAPYQWKRDVIGFDLYDVKPWLDKVKQTQNDVDFWDVCVQYVAAFQDSHDEYTIPSNYTASLHFDVDIYDGKVLVDGIDRSWLPRTDYPFTVGDELISVDGIPVADLIKAYIPYAANGSASTSTRQRLAADTITFRIQSIMPKAYQIPEKSTIVVLRASGVTETYSVKWDQLGTPITTAGILPSFVTGSAVPPARQVRLKKHDETTAVSHSRHSGDSDNPSPADNWGVWHGDGPDVDVENVPQYLKPLQELQQMSALIPDSNAAQFGLITPAFNPPPGFKLRLGGSRNDFFLSGTFAIGNVTVGFIRIPTMSPASSATALQQFTAEIAFLEKNTDALVIDVMRNGGGSLCYTESLMANLTSGPYTAANYNIRATVFWLATFDGLLQSAKTAHAPTWVTDLYGAYVKDIQSALKGNRAMTGTLPICGASATLTGLPSAYSKPIVALVDGFSLSAAEAFSMMLQDSGRATIIGTRTDGGGGNPGSYYAGDYSEGNTRVTRTFVVRGKSVQTPGFPASQWLENTGVFPDVQADIMTKENLLNGGSTFVTQVGIALAGRLQ